MSPTISATPLVVDGYVRVSKVGGRAGRRFISPALQREQIHAWAKARGAHVLEVFEELDESGARADRPLLQEAIRRVEAGISQGVVVAVLDRFGRSLVDSLALIDRIQAAGGTFVAVQNGLDLTTDTGRLVLRIMLSLAEYDLDRIRSNWDAARAHAIARGVHLGPKPPTGYRRLKSGRLRPDPVSGPVVSELFARRADGESITRLCRFMEQRGVITPYGNSAWCYTSLRGVLANRVYLGEVRCAPHVREGAHPPLTDPVTWQRAQAPRELPRAQREPPVAARRTRPLRGVRHEHERDRARRDADGGRGASTCARAITAPASCPAPASIAGNAARALRRGHRLRAAAISTAATDRQGRATPSERWPRCRQRSSPTATARACSPCSTRTLSPTGSPCARAASSARCSSSPRARARRDAHELPPADELEERWPTMDICKHADDVIRQVIDCVIVARGKAARPGPRHASSRSARGPTDLPRRGDKHTPLRNLEALHDDPAAVAQASATTTVEPHAAHARAPRLRRHPLTVAARRGVPRRRTFPPAPAGHAPGRRSGGGPASSACACARTTRRGGAGTTTASAARSAPTSPARPPGRPAGSSRPTACGPCAWRSTATAASTAGSTSSAYRASTGSTGQTGYWTEQRIRDRLATICNGRTIFPTRMEFQRAGLSGMVYAMQRDRGIEWWARQTGLPRYRFRAGLVPS